MERLKVIFIAGSGRTGSTLLGQVLGQLPGFVYTGEIMQYWRAMSEDGGRICACGHPLDECPYWTAVASRLALGVGDSQALRRDLQEEVRSRHALRLYRRAVRGEIKGMPFADRLDELYVAAGATAEARVLVDSSKFPTVALEASTFKDIDLYIVHLIRDPRSIVNSNQRAKQSAGGEASLRARGFATIIARWHAWNIMISTLVRRRVPASHYRRISYERFAEDPQGVIAEIAALVGEAPATTPFVDERTVELEPCHDFAGNPDRFIAGSREIRRDDRWRSQLPKRLALATLVLTTPLRQLLLRGADRAAGPDSD